MTSRHPGPAPEVRGRAAAFAHGAVRAELDQIRRRPFSMPSGWLVLALTCLTAIAILSAATDRDQHGFARLPTVLIYVLAHLAGLAGSIGLIAIAQLLEALRFATAPHAYLIRTSDGAAGAYVTTERGRLTLSSLWAWPRRTGLGAQVLAQASRDVESDGSQLWLVAANKDLVSYYQRHGFRRVRRVLLGHLMVHDPTRRVDGSVQDAMPLNG